MIPLIPYLTTVLALLLPQVLALNIQASNLVSDARKAAAIKASFKKSWDGYAKYCFGHDALNPLSKTCNDNLAGWGATVIDAQGTALVSGSASDGTRVMIRR